MPVVVAADVAVGVYELEVERDGVYGLDIGNGHTVVHAAAVAQVGGEGLDGPLSAAEHNALIEDGESGDGVGAGEGLARYLVEIGDVNGVVALVEGDGLDVHLGIQQLRALGPDAEGVVYVGLGPDGGVNPEVFYAVFVIRLTVLKIWRLKIAELELQGEVAGFGFLLFGVGYFHAEGLQGAVLVGGGHGGVELDQILQCGGDFARVAAAALIYLALEACPLAS